MDYFGDEFVGEIPSIAPDLMFTDEYQPPSPVIEPKVLSQLDRNTILQFVFSDHAYSKPYPVLSSTDEKNKKPLTVLKLHPSDFLDQSSVSDEEIDIETVDKPDDLVRYDKNKAHNVMQEVELYLHSLWKDVDKDDVEKISRTNWSKEQSRLFDTVNKIINNYQLSKLTYTSNINEPVLRKLALEKATKRFRKAFGSLMWNSKVLVWLHGIMIDGLGSSLFLCYLEILQSLKRKVPALFERVFLNNKGAAEKELTAGLPNLGVRLRKTWEPSIDLQTKVILQNFPTTPSLILIPSGPSVPHQSTKRNRFWNNQLMRFGKVYPVSAPAYRTPEGYVIKYYLEHCISVVRTNISECRNRFPERHVVLIGWGVGSLIACKVSTLDKVDAVICLGFPCNGIDGEESEEYWETFTTIECPVLFYVGTHALSNSIQKIEKLRERMKGQTNLIVIESADDLLRLTKSQKRLLGMTQNMIDKLIQDQMYLFLKNTLYKPKFVSLPPKSNASPKKRKKKIDGNETAPKKKKKNLKAPPSGKTSPNLQLSMDIPTSSSVSPSTHNPILQGLLTTGSISTTIPVTQMHHEALISPTIKVVGQTATDGPTLKSGVKKAKEKTAASKAKSKKQPKNFTAHLGTHKSGNLSGQCFSSGELSYPKSSLNQVTFQRVSNGSFVLSGTSGQLRLQGGTNIVYLQQASSGATQLIHTPLVANSSGTFTAVLSTTATGSTASSFSFVPSTVAHKTMSQGRVISSGGISKSQQQQHVTTGFSGVVTTSVGVVTTSVSKSATSVKTSTIMTHLSANDLRYLANLIAKHSANQTNFSLNAPVTNKYLGTQTPVPNKASNSTTTDLCRLSTTLASTSTNKSHLSSQYSVTATQQEKSPTVLKTSRMASDGGKSIVSVISSKALPMVSTSPKAAQKIPVTLTIPISRLQTPISNSLSKSISVPGLSAYLAQQKFVLTSSKAGLVNRAVLLSPGMVKRESPVSSPLSSISKHSISFTHPSLSKALSSTYVSSKPTGTITLHLPTQNMKDQATLRKAAADIKLVGLLSEQAKRSVKSSNPTKSGFPSSSLLATNDKIAKITVTSEGLKSICGGAPKSTANLLPLTVQSTMKKMEPKEESEIDFAVAPCTSQSSSVLNKSITMVNNNATSSFGISERPVSSTANSRNNLISMQETIHAMNSGKSKTQMPSNHHTSNFDSSNTQSISRSDMSSLISTTKQSKNDMHENRKVGFVSEAIVVTSEPTIAVKKSNLFLDATRNITQVKYPTIKTPFVSVVAKGDSKYTPVSSLPKSVLICSPKTSSESTKTLFPVTVTKSDFVRMSSLNKGDVTSLNKGDAKSPLKSLLETDRVISAPASSQSSRETKPSTPMNEATQPKVLEEETNRSKSPTPLPYVTRSGRVLKNRHPYSDEHDKKMTPTRKRRRTPSLSKDESFPEKKPDSLQMSPTVKLDSLVEAANLIKNDQQVSNVSEFQANEKSLEGSNVDSTTSIAANAMLALLTGETKASADIPSDKDQLADDLSTVGEIDVGKGRNVSLGDSDDGSSPTVPKETESSNEARMEGEE